MVPATEGTSALKLVDSPEGLASARRFTVAAALAPVLPEGLPRGVVVTVSAIPRPGGGATSLALALTAGPSHAGSWVGCVGLSSLGLLAAAEAGASWERLVLVELPAPHMAAAAVAAMVDGFDVVLVGEEVVGQLTERDGRRLLARIRERGVVLVCVGSDLPGGSAGLALTVTAQRWEGLSQGGGGCLSRRRLQVRAVGRGAPGRAHRAEVLVG